MKLHNYSSSYFAAILFFLLSLWAVIFYFEMLDEIYDSLDDGLENQKRIVIQKARHDPSLLLQENFDNGSFAIRQTNTEAAKTFTDSFRDTLMYMENEADYEPVRLLESVFEQDGNFYKMQVITSMVEEDDLIKELFFSLLWLYLGLILSILLLNSLLQKKIWKPFYSLLNRLEGFHIERDRKILIEPSHIDEFKLLNTKIEKLIQKSVESFDSQKEFIENASHELQTPLAISINKLELLVEKNQLTAEQMEEVGSVLHHLERLTRFNKSLLLLSKIENRQFLDEELVDFNVLAKTIAAYFQSFADHKNMELKIKETGQINYLMNKDMANILLSNLIKNALIHSSAGSTVTLELEKDLLRVSNPAAQGPLDSTKLFSRFQASSKKEKSTGLGLSISRSIAHKYALELNYYYREAHNFEIRFPHQSRN